MKKILVAGAGGFIGGHLVKELQNRDYKVRAVDIKLMDPHYIRQNITYINQNSRLFDKTIIDNIMYGCKDDDICKEYFENINNVFMGFSCPNKKPKTCIIIQIENNFKD